MQNPKYIGDRVWTAAAFTPAATVAATLTGAAFDRMTQGGEQGFDSAVLQLATGAATGTPTSFTVTTTIQDSADGSTGWATLSDASVDVVSTASSGTRAEINLSSAKRFVRAVSVVAFVGGTAPTVVAAGVWVFGGAHKIPVTSMTA